MQNSFIKNLFGGNKMNSNSKEARISPISILILMAISLSVLAIAVFAANGLGEIVDYFPQVVTEGTGLNESNDKELVVTIHNNENVGEGCIDEIIITAPDNWVGTAVVEEVTNMGATIDSNEADADDTTYNNLVNDLQSVRIIPDLGGNPQQTGVMLCLSGKTTIRISGLIAPDVDPEGEDAELKALIEGKSMTCPYAPGSFNSQLMENLFAGIDECDGELKDIIQQLVAFT